MSDDGYEAYSDYSDFEDLLYDADPAPDLADDLASHAIHSPIFADEPGYELLEYHSDWEYYSDDYYDDDPDLLRKNPQEGSPLKSPKQVKRGKKRKLADLEDIPDLDLGERMKLRDCIKGTVWARPAAERDNVFRTGQEEKVALLKDWQNRFGATTVQQPGKSKRPRLQKDESWANDLSLADMGLLNERGNRVEQSSGPQDAQDDDEEEDGDYQGGDEDDEAVAAALAEISGAMLDAATPETEGAIQEEMNGDSEAPQIHPPKQGRRTKDVLPSPPTSTESTTLNGIHSTAAADEQDLETTRPKRGRGRPRRDQTFEDNDGSSDGSQEQVPRTDEEALVQRNKKRKASASPPPDSKVNSLTGTRLIAPRRAKRIASNAIAGLSDPTKNTGQSLGTATRSTRGKKGG